MRYRDDVASSIRMLLARWRWEALSEDAADAWRDGHEFLYSLVKLFFGLIAPGLLIFAPLLAFVVAAERRSTERAVQKLREQVGRIHRFPDEN